MANAADQVRQVILASAMLWGLMAAL